RGAGNWSVQAWLYDTATGNLRSSMGTGIIVGAPTTSRYEVEAENPIIDQALAFADKRMVTVSRNWSDPNGPSELTAWDLAVKQTPFDPGQGKRLDGAGQVRCVALSAGGAGQPALLAAGSADGVVRLIDPGTGKEVAVLKGHAAGVRCV